MNRFHFISSFLGFTVLLIAGCASKPIIPPHYEQYKLIDLKNFKGATSQKDFNKLEIEVFTMGSESSTIAKLVYDKIRTDISSRFSINVPITNPYEPTDTRHKILVLYQAIYIPTFNPHTGHNFTVLDLLVWSYIIDKVTGTIALLTQGLVRTIVISDEAISGSVAEQSKRIIESLGALIY